MSEALARPAVQPNRLHTLLVLGRVSNLSTVWSNCLAAWLISGGTDARRLSLLTLGATLLYLGGMFLNDACDVGFDRQHRPERPIVSGRITAGAVWTMGSALLGLGWLNLLLLGLRPGLVGAVLVAAIVLYDLVHKRLPLSPVVMAVCRVLLYLLAAVVATTEPPALVVWRALALGGYIVGLSCLARVESTRAPAARWPMVLLLAPILVASLTARPGERLVWVLVAMQVFWMLWCLWPRDQVIRRRVPVGVAGLLAGIVLVDWLAAVGAEAKAGAFAALFVLALLSQRYAPAT